MPSLSLSFFIFLSVHLSLSRSVRKLLERSGKSRRSNREINPGIVNIYLIIRRIWKCERRIFRWKTHAPRCASGGSRGCAIFMEIEICRVAKTPGGGLGDGRGGLGSLCPSPRRPSAPPPAPTLLSLPRTLLLIRAVDQCVDGFHFRGVKVLHHCRLKSRDPPERERGRKRGKGKRKKEEAGSNPIGRIERSFAFNSRESTTRPKKYSNSSRNFLKCRPHEENILTHNIVPLHRIIRIEYWNIK